MTSLLHFTFPETFQLKWLSEHYTRSSPRSMPQFYVVNKIEKPSPKNVSIKMGDIVDARTLRRLNRLKKRESAENALKTLQNPDPVLFVDMPWYQLNLNALLDSEEKPYIWSQPLYVCKSCYEYNTAYSTDFVPVECDANVNTSTALEAVVDVPKDNSSEMSVDSNWTNVSSLKADELSIVQREYSETPIKNILAVDLSGALVDLSANVIDLSGAPVYLSEVTNTPSDKGLELRAPSDVKSCTACCTIC